MKYDYGFLKKRIRPFREELMSVFFDPNRVSYFLHQYNYDLYKEVFVEA